MIRYLKGLCAAVIVVLISGCWSQVNFDQITVVSAIGLDLNKDKQLIVTIQLVNPTLPVAAGGAIQQSKAIATYSAIGHTIKEAIDVIRMQSKKDLFFSQTRVLLLSEGLAKHGIEDIVDFFWREPNQNFNTWVLVVDGSTIPESLSQSKELLAVSSDEWKAYLEDTTNVGTRRGIQLYEFLSRLDQPQGEAVAPVLSPAKGKTEEIIMEIGRLAVFRGYRLAGLLTSDESQYMNWLSHSTKSGTTQLKLKKSDYIDFDLSNIRVNITPRIENNKLFMKTFLKSEAHIQSSTIEVDLTSKETTLQIEEQLNQHLEKEITRTLHQIFDSYQSDVVGLGAAFHRKYPQQWKRLEENWHSHLSSVDIVVETDVHIIKSGLLIDGILKKEEYHE